MDRSRSRPKSKPTSDWAALLSDALRQHSRTPPGTGWKTLAEIRTELDVGKDTAYMLVNSMKKAGKLECFSGSERVGNTLRRRSWYRIKK